MLCSLFPNRIVTHFCRNHAEDRQMICSAVGQFENHQKYNADYMLFVADSTAPVHSYRTPSPAVLLGLALCAALYTALFLPIRCCVLCDADR
jgi:hypothetical protein